MHFHQLTHQIREARIAKGLTQQALAEAAGLSRTTLNQIENGVVADIGVRKLKRVLEEVGLTLEAGSQSTRLGKDYLVMWCISANTSHRKEISPDELARTLLSGKVASMYFANLRAAFDEAPRSVVEGALNQLSEIKSLSALKVNLAAIARQIKSDRYRSEASG